ncbi:aspartate aminotransferase family protein [Solimonas marina]|uniref:Acetylornithine aminotransferase n=1 Tax=Solimonas marina TaxID=2714601 RepID=A0A969WD45_9GAMM|nr:aspartate aminotransferase family protein [Solimonas marina]NKF24019.1 aspartate aminotransferase family protein [Solimonas marina]
MSSSVTRQTFDEVMVPTYSPTDIIPVRGQGSRWWDREDREYIDFSGGIAVNVLGHAHPAMIKALTEQAQKLWHLSNIMTNEPALKLAQRLTELTFADKVFFSNSGAEANEAAFKLARRWGNTNFGPHKSTIISFQNAFHGRTLFTVCVGGQPKYTQGFEPLPGGIRHLPFNDVAALEAAMNDTVCAVVMEPIQGEGGVLPATPAFAQAARALCDKHQALLVFDEVQTGNGHTGTLYAYEQLGVTPDVMTTAKGLGGGFPIGAMLTTSEIAKALPFGTHGSTFGGNPLACAVAGAVLDEITRPEIAANIAARSQQLQDGLRALGQRYGVFGAPRGQGLLLGAPVSDAWVGRAREISAAALKQGLWVLVAGPDTLRFAPALNLTEQDVAEGLERLDRALATLVADGKASAAA